MTNTTAARIRVGLVLTVAVLAIFGILSLLHMRDSADFGRYPAPGTVSSHNTPSGRCQEDDPCWEGFCWFEHNASQPGGTEKICGTAQQERDAEANG